MLAETSSDSRAEPARVNGADCAEQARINGSHRALARINGAKSNGPVTPEGKARSAQNARRHGLRAKGPVDEAGRALLEGLTAELLGQWRPRTAIERMLVEQAANALWRIAQADRHEALILTTGLESDEGNISGAELFLDPAGQRALALLMRYRGAAERQLQRARRMLADIAAARMAYRPAAPRAPESGIAPENRVAPESSALPRDSAFAERTEPPPPNRRDRRRLDALERRATG